MTPNFFPATNTSNQCMTPNFFQVGAQTLAEQLRLIIEPTKRSRLRGDYKSGKRLNMRRIIPYVASNFRKDRIWLRRTKPAKRECEVRIL